MPKETFESFLKVSKACSSYKQEGKFGPDSVPLETKHWNNLTSRWQIEFQYSQVNCSHFVFQLPYHTASPLPAHPQLLCGGEDWEEGWSHVSTRHVTHKHPHNSQMLSYSLWNKKLCLFETNTLRLQMILTDAFIGGKGPQEMPSKSKVLGPSRANTLFQPSNPSHPKSFLVRTWAVLFLADSEDPSLVKNRTHKQKTCKPLVNVMLIKVYIRWRGEEHSWSCQTHFETGIHFSSGADTVVLEENWAHWK